MAQVEFQIDNSKSDLIICYKERIEQLFGVAVSISTRFVDDGNLAGNNNFTLQLSSSSSQESVAKANVFVKAVLEESRDFIIDRDHLPAKDFDMVLKASPTIQRQTLSVLDFDLGALEVCTKGHRDNVQAAKLHIQRLIMGPQNMESACQSQQQSTASSRNEYDLGLVMQNLNNRTSDVQSDKVCDPFTSSHRDLDNNLIMPLPLDFSHPQPMRSFSVTTDAELDYPSISGPDLIDRGIGKSPNLSRSFADVVSLKDVLTSSEMCKTASVCDNVELKAKDCLSGQSSSSEDDGEVNVVDKTDPRYDTHLEFAIKLGYTETDLDRVIIRHGIDCNEDRLLHELIDNSAGSAHLDSDRLGTVSPVTVAPDFANSEEFLGVMKKVSKSEDSSSNLRHIVIDGSNVAMSHGKNVFSCRGIKIAVDWFRHRGHEEVTVFVPQWRKETSRPDTPITDQELLTELEKEGIVVFTPARRIKGRRVVCYDDRFVLKLAAETDGIVVSNDNYRDLLNENKEYRTVVDERLLMYTFVNDRFMPPEDPLGRRGPTLDNFLCKEPTSPPSLPPECPYGRKCTYGNKCKYHHPERGSQPHKTVTEVLKEQASLKMQERAVKGPEPIDKARRPKPKLTRTRSLAPGEGIGADKSSSLSPLPSALQESDSDVISRKKSPTRSGGKTSDYLREHRKKLEEIMAISSASDALSVKEQTTSGGSPGPIPPPSTRSQEALSPVPGVGSRVSSPSHLNVPYSSSQEGQLVSGHLLLAKKLSDEASESSFFSPDNHRESTVTLAGPGVGGVGRQDVAYDKLCERRQSLQDHHGRQFYPAPSYGRESEPGLLASQHPPHPLSGFQHAMPGYGAQCQSFPMTEKEAPRNVLRRVTSYSEHPTVTGLPAGLGMESGHGDHVPLKPQHSCPPGHYPPSPAPFSGPPFRGMMRQNSSSDPQLHMSGTGDTAFNPWYAAMPPPSSVPMVDARSPHPAYGSDQRGAADPHHLYSRSTSVQPSFRQPQYAGLDRQLSDVLPGGHEHGMTAPYMTHWDMGGVCHSHPTTPTRHPLTMPHHSPMPSMPQSGVTAWSQSRNPAHAMPLSPVKAPQAPRSFPPDQPIPPTDARYSLYYHLCGIFAEHRVRAVMNKFPDERDPQTVCMYIANNVSELSNVQR